MTIGEQLRRAREARSISLETAAQATHIRVHYLKALEADQFDLLPSPAQVRGFLRAYSGYIKLDAGPLLAALDGTPLPEPKPVVAVAAPADRTPRSEEATDAPAQAEQAALKEESRPAPSQAASIFVEIGQRLRNQREALGLSIEDVERQTHIRGHYLKTLEAGDLNGLPSPVQGRGMLNNYAHFLGLDTDPLLLRFADGLQARLAEKKSAMPAPARPARKANAKLSTLGRLFSTDFLIGGIFVIFLVAFTAWATLRISNLRTSGEATPTAPSVAEVLAGDAGPTETATPTLATAQPTGANGTSEGGDLPPPATPEPGAEGEEPEADPNAANTGATATPDFGTSPVQVYVIVQQRTWMRVIVDGEVQFEGRAMAGSAYPFAGDQRVELVAGNGAGVQVIFNTQDLGVLGLFGQVVGRVFTLQGIQTPTPVISPTPLPSETPTPTLEGAPTETLTPTVAP
ncbi:MAG TPA: DUF4115 domain-containing protein [Anaerolineales bacterium]|nr:DUF4115 domain-containing protein [Anaerolineales bacterium]